MGIYIDEELSWKHHINHIASKISKMTGIMAKARHHLASKTLLTLYHTMIYPYLNYCNNIWGSTYPTRLLSIFKTQKKIVMTMTFSNYNDDTKPLFQSLKILNIYQLNTYLKAVFKTCIHITTTNFQHSLITFLLPMKPYTLIIHDQCSRYILNLIEQIMVNFL